jgi:DNA-binding transcriptional LysR family regulator
MRELLAFVDVARQLNFTRAAATLGVCGATFSQTLPGWRKRSECVFSHARHAAFP